ncbi:MAG: hypothetical protein COW00_03530 [Bdellovibrio sp. CG12_big_fil_rev_8_21_14_0_65_39_13]|nr:MAG: hypothetical protein COW78_19550 [Bdellovibrio sp. CG22_combo_CG10-13_8_21_14_all_39_27]PIQ61531.1 MAG: hypothetical protein COW00_03530 [Bdellovibrio sp. CG12_big_fil_rev_8_21_14_0_65_39_13]PIR35948.1 MAG: hypothetical protein COV37_06020 [Bdellovibrio sp. CG11_big_fil_rev_8_21_14_0_20_39_38]
MKLQDWLRVDFKDCLDITDRIEIPETHFSYHWSELPKEIIDFKFPHVVELCRQKSSKFRGDGSYQDYRWLLNKNYNRKSDEDTKNNVFWRQNCLPSEPLEIEYEQLSAILFTEVFDGNIQKRKFRLHLNNEIDFIFLRRGQGKHFISGMKFKLISIADNYLLIKVPKKALSNFMRFNKFKIRFNLHQIFKGRSLDRDVEDSYTLDLDPNLFEFNDNVMKIMVFGKSKDEDKILKIPFEAFKPGLRTDRFKQIIFQQFFDIQEETINQLASL